MVTHVQRGSIGITFTQTRQHCPVLGKGFAHMRRQVHLSPNARMLHAGEYGSHAIVLRAFLLLAVRLGQSDLKELSGAVLHKRTPKAVLVWIWEEERLERVLRPY
jgi:hypothetical protein